MTMKDFPDMPIPDRRSEEQLPSRLIQTELAYDVSKLRSHVGQCVNNFTIEQKAAFDRIMEAVNQPQRKVGLADFNDHCILLFLFYFFLGGRDIHYTKQR